MMASSFASSSSALVRKPDLFVSWTSSRSRSALMPLPEQPLVTLVRRSAASAIIFLMSSPRLTGLPPSF